MDRRSVHRHVATTAEVAGIHRPIGPHALRRSVGTSKASPCATCDGVLRHAHLEATLGSDDITGEALERHASLQIAGFLPAGWAG